MTRLKFLLILIITMSTTICLAQPNLADEDKAVVSNQAPYKIDRFEPEIKAFEQKDVNLEPTGKDMTLFVGSSTFKMWSDLEQRFKDVHAVNRGFGGATIDEINHYARRVVLKYKPARIVFYAGTNDIAAGDSGRQVYLDFVEFVRIVHQELPDTRIYFVSTSAGPSRLGMIKQYEEANALIRDYAKRTGQCRFVDITPVMHDRRGKLKKEFFLADDLHMNKAGYDEWEPIIRDALKH